MTHPLAAGHCDQYIHMCTCSRAKPAVQTMFQIIFSNTINASKQRSNHNKPERRENTTTKIKQKSNMKFKKEKSSRMPLIVLSNIRLGRLSLELIVHV